MGRLLGRMIRMVIVSAVLGALFRAARAVLERRTGGGREAAIRTGSFDSWPAVPSAPGHRTET